MENGISSHPHRDSTKCQHLCLCLAANSKSVASCSNGPNLSPLTPWPQDEVQKWEAGVYRGAIQKMGLLLTENCSEKFKRGRYLLEPDLGSSKSLHSPFILLSHHQVQVEEANTAGTHCPRAHLGTAHRLSGDQRRQSPQHLAQWLHATPLHPRDDIRKPLGSKILFRKLSYS